MRVKIAKWGNSAAIRLPKAVMEGLRLEEGGEAEIRIANGEMRMKPIPLSNRITKAELIASMDEFGSSGQYETIDWGEARGSEVIDDEYSRVSTPLTKMGGKKRAS